MNYKNSQEYLARASKVTPGAAQTLSKMSKRFPQGAFPVAVDYGVDAQVVDVDGNIYVDWICGLGAVTLGYGHPYVNQAVVQQAARGATFSLPHHLELSLAERLCQKIPCAEMVRFVNSGSEATEAAIRTARIATGRDIILTVKDGYHSWHSWFQAVKDWRPGIPAEYESMIDWFQYNKASKLIDCFEAHYRKVAAVILEPCLFESPKDRFLETIRELCDHFGAVLIFDEMVTGYRWALAGGQEYFRVTPDLATFGKGMANGYPIGMLCGKAEYMQHAELISGTFGGNAVSLAAANAVLDVYENEPIIKAMWERGENLQHYFNTTAEVIGTWARADGYPCKPRFTFAYPGDNGETNKKAMALFLQVAAENGVLFHPGGFNVCSGLSDKDVGRTYRAVDLALRAVHNAEQGGDWSELKGSLCEPVVTVRK